MPLPNLEPTTSYRKHPALAAIFKAAENRHLTELEIAEYRRALPMEEKRLAAAKEIASQEQAVVERVLVEIFAAYPFEANHAYAHSKCMRDIRSVSAYATLSMLMNDPHWFRDKLLLWLRTILQALYFPDREVAIKKTMFGAAAGGDVSQLAVNQRSIFETYSKLKNVYKERLTPESFALIESYLEQAVSTLSAK
jgi:Phycobilisome protein